MSDVNPPTSGEPPAVPPVATPAPMAPPAVPEPAVPGAPVPPQYGVQPPKSRPGGTMSVIAIVLAGIALILAFLGPLAFLSWFFGLPAFILGIIATVRKAGKRGLAIAAIIVSTLAFLISLVVFIVSLGTAVSEAIDESNGGATVKEETTEPTQETADEATDEPAADETEEAADAGTDAGAAGSFDNPIDVGVVWTYDSSWFGEDATVWDGVVDGVTEIPLNEYSDEEGTCFAIVGSLTPTSLADGENFTSWIDAPSFSLVVNGTIQDEFGFCDEESVESAGYASLLDVEVGLGTEYKYYDAIFVPTTVEGDPEMVVIGDASGDEALYVKATAIDLS